jgi:predicted kinase
MRARAKLIFFCGKMAAGKSTFARNSSITSVLNITPELTILKAQYNVIGRFSGPNE